MNIVLATDEGYRARYATRHRNEGDIVETELEGEFTLNTATEQVTICVSKKGSYTVFLEETGNCCDYDVWPEFEATEEGRAYNSYRAESALKARIERVEEGEE